MNCTQETYHRCLATVAPREVEAAQADYEARILAALEAAREQAYEATA